MWVWVCGGGGSYDTLVWLRKSHKSARGEQRTYLQPDMAPQRHAAVRGRGDVRVGRPDGQRDEEDARALQSGHARPVLPGGGGLGREGQEEGAAAAGGSKGRGDGEAAEEAGGPGHGGGPGGRDSGGVLLVLVHLTLHRHREAAPCRCRGRHHRQLAGRRLALILLLLLLLGIGDVGVAQRQQPRVDAHEEEGEARERVGGGRGEGAEARDGEREEGEDALEQRVLQPVVPDDAREELLVREALRGGDPAWEEEEEEDERADEPACGGLCGCGYDWFGWSSPKANANAATRHGFKQDKRKKSHIISIPGGLSVAR